MLRRGVLALAAVVALNGCSRPSGEAAAPKYDNPPVILISVDTLRADRLPAYGYSAVETPHLDAFRADGILFENAYSHCPMTLPAHASMLTGLLPPQHGVRNNLGYVLDTAKYKTVAQMLKEKGYATGAAVSTYVLRGDTGFRKAFDFYDDEMPAIAGDALGSHQRGGLQTLAVASKWIAEKKNAPFFFMFHIYEPHAPYSPPEPFRSRYRDPYDGEIAAADDILGRFFAELKRLGVYDKSLIILTSDHGEGLGDHGEQQHGILLYRELIRVPMLVKLPGAERKGETRSEPVALVDIPPTISEVSGLHTGGSAGRSLLEAAEANRTVYSETFYPRIHLGWSELRSQVGERFHYIDGPKPELYDIVADPAERVDVIDRERREASRLRTAIRELESELPPLGSVDPETARKLAALGYLGSAQSPTDAGGPLPNPRDELPILDRMGRAFATAESGRLSEAADELRAIVAEHPRLLDAWDKLGDVLTREGRYDDAAETYRAAIARFPNFSTNLTLSLGFVQLAQGKLEEARTHADLGMGSNGPKAHELLARVALARGDFANARRELDASLAGQGRQPALELLRAEIQKGEGDLRGALATVASTERVARETNTLPVPRLEFIRADLLARLDQPEAAEAAYRREIAAFPRNEEAYANLAVVLMITGREREASEMLQRLVRQNPHRGARELAAKTYEMFDMKAEAQRIRSR
jgi:arylsulfatase A-like enzyme/Flp pilus assembly protein TadD